MTKKGEDLGRHDWEEGEEFSVTDIGRVKEKKNLRIFSFCKLKYWKLEVLGKKLFWQHFVTMFLHKNLTNAICQVYKN